MATLALAAAGAAIGGAVMPAGLTVLGATITGATIGSQIGALAGSYIDQTLLGARGASRAVAGPRLSELAVTSSTEGAPIARLYGQARLGGQVIWAADIEEETVTVEAGGGGKGGGAPGGGGGGVTQTDYRYYASFAVAICEGEISSLTRIWADGQELDLTSLSWRLHRGTQAQEPDSLISAMVGEDRAPAYRGVAYVVFERLALTAFGNRLPQLSFEVSRASDDLDQLVKGVVLIPGSGEFVYATDAVTREGADDSRIPENVHQRQAETDWAASLDQLQAQLPEAKSVSLVVSWFGDDLRAGACTIAPRVERSEKNTEPLTWRVAGLDRLAARVVSLLDGRPAYGGTPSDETVIAAIRDLKARGIAVTLNPFVLMDVPAGNGLADPYTDAASQPAFPWRGRITVFPAPGRPGSPDKSAAAAVAVRQFCGVAQPSHFTIADDAVVYAGPDEWSYRRFILHYAKLAAAAGGVDAFLIGSELRGMTTIRDGAGYPFVGQLRQLATDVKTILGAATKVTYAADWSEYFGHQPADGSGDVAFHLDPLWASPAIDAVGIDLYWPLADWRDGSDHLDRIAGASSAYDLDYLKGNIAGGEGFDWYYASADDRAAQIRTPITDGAGKPWVFRPKDLKSWWLNRHYDRPGGVEAATPTEWVPQSKPVWFMEIGCPAVDKGANQPNAFVDPKSSESGLPYFSSGRRDDLIQRRYLRALIEALTPGHAGAVAGLNPVSAVYGGAMIDPSHIHVYAWDARPYPAFPSEIQTWGDAANWRLGHWVQGRIARGALAEVVGQILSDHGFADYDTGGLTGTVPGFVVDRVMSARDTLQPLELAYFFDAVESGGVIRFAERAAAEPVTELAPDALVENGVGRELMMLTRAQDTDLPASAKISYVGLDNDYRQAVAEARRLTGSSGRVGQAELPLVLDADFAAALAETWLFETWAAREKIRLTLPPSLMAIEPGDVLRVRTASGARLFRVVDIGDHGARDADAVAVDPSVYRNEEAAALRPRRRPPAVSAGKPAVAFLDLPLIGDRADGPAYYVAATRKPWPGAVAIYRSPEVSGFQLAGRATAASVMGSLVDPLPAGPISRIDRANTIRVRLRSGTLASATPLAFLSGANLAAVSVDGDTWEVIQFEKAELIAASTYVLSGLLRGQAGTEDLMAEVLPGGASFVLLDRAVVDLELALGDISVPLQWRVGPASRDISHADFVAVEKTAAGRSLSPLAPVHVRGQRANEGLTIGDLTIGWTRRTRVQGDNWELADVPLGEDGEAYEVEILDGGTVRRVLSSIEPRVVYTAAQQTADFGTVPSAVTVRVRQLSAIAGRGVATIAII